MKQIRMMIRSVVRLLPIFALTALGGCLIALAAHVSLDHMAVVVAVPTVVAFMLSRLLVLMVPRVPPKKVPNPSTWSLFLALPVFLSIAGTAILSLSSAVYYTIGLHVVAKHAAIWSAAAFFLGCLQFVIFICAAWAAANRVDRRLRLLLVREELIFWDVMRFPTQLSVKVFGHFGDPF